MQSVRKSGRQSGSVQGAHQDLVAGGQASLPNQWYLAAASVAAVDVRSHARNMKRLSGMEGSSRNAKVVDSCRRTSLAKTGRRAIMTPPIALIVHVRSDLTRSSWCALQVQREITAG
jgi:hypothetical protein